MTADPKTCLTCGKPVKGRADKKFCDDYCRNAYNNQLNSDSNHYVRKVNQILRRNRRILETLVPAKEETAKISRNKLRDKGFNFDYFTNTYTTRKETVYFYCYEYGYLLLEDDWCLLVRRKEQMT